MFTVKLAEHIFRIDNVYPYMQQFCKDYIIADDENAPLIAANEKERAFENKDGGNWPDPYLETLALYRKIAEAVIPDGAMLFHGSALALNGQGVIFTGKSGTGKSTHARLWRSHFGDNIVTVNDDKPILTFKEGEIRVWGTPYGGKDNLQANTSAPVRAVVILRQGPCNTCRQLTAAEAFPILFSQTYRPENPLLLTQTIDLVNRLSEEVSLWEMTCTISDEAVTVCHAAVFGEKYQ